MSKTIVPFGPQHPVLPEPIHLSLTVEDEIVKGCVITHQGQIVNEMIAEHYGS